MKRPTEPRPDGRSAPADAIPSGDPALHALAQAARLEVEYRDGTKQWRRAPDDAVREVLAALGLDAHDMAAARRSLARLRRAHVRPGLPDVIVAWEGRSTTVRVRVPPGERATPLGFRIHFEDGGERDWTLTPDGESGMSLHAEGEHTIAHEIALPRRLPIGYHTLEVRLGEETARAHLLVAPLEAPRTERSEWGLFIPTYALHSEASLGVGDLSDLTRVAGWVRNIGGTIVATLPLLDTFLDAPIHDPSPYAPISRRFWSGLLVDPTVEPEYMHPRVRAVRETPEHRAEVEAARASGPVDHARVWRLKRRLLVEMAEALESEDTPRRRAFRHWSRHHPDVLRYARFRAATTRHGTWHGWPTEAKEGDLEVLEVDEREVRMHAYVQWIADLQVAGVADENLGDLRLHLDLPLGTHADGYDTWNDRAAYAHGIEVGAPPDGFFEKGQKWGFAPLNPRRLRQSGYRHFAACLRHHLRHATLLRIDHVMALHRLFWVPRGRPATEGVYVHYPAEELYAVVLIEAFRAGALIVGEDLGTVPKVVHEAMDRHHFHRTYVLQLQARTGEGQPPHPDVNSLATLNTHDMVPFAAWWRGDDIGQRQQRGFIDEEEAAAAKAQRERVKARLMQHVRQERPDEGSAPGPGDRKTLPPETGEARDGLIEFLARSRAALVLLNAEDLWLETAPQNQPGFGPDTPEGRRNWARRTRGSLEEWFHDTEVRDRLEALDRLRRAAPPPVRASKDGRSATAPPDASSRAQDGRGGADRAAPTSPSAHQDAPRGAPPSRGGTTDAPGRPRSTASGEPVPHTEAEPRRTDPSPPDQTSSPPRTRGDAPDA